MREIARRFNERFGEVLVVPEHRIPEVGARIMDLQEPESKMSTTTGGEAGTVYVLDEPDAIRKKLGSAVTDSGREVRRGEDKPGITNLIDILAVASGSDPATVESDFADAGYGDFKKAVAEATVELPRAGARALRRAAPRRGGPRGRARRRRREGARDRLGDARRGARGDGHRPAALSWAR